VARRLGVSGVCVGGKVSVCKRRQVNTWGGGTSQTREPFKGYGGGGLPTPNTRSAKKFFKKRRSHKWKNHNRGKQSHGEPPQG